MSGQMPVLVKVSLGQFVCAHTQVCVVGVLCVGGGVVFQVVKCSRTPETEDFLKMLRNK